MAVKIIWLLFVGCCYVAGQTSPPTVGVTVTGSTVATLQPITTIPSSSATVATPSISTAVATPSNNTVAAIQTVAEDRFHHCTACPFESDHHQCNDPFMLDNKFEVSADMCNVINTDKEQIKRLCKRYPKGYFFQCPKDGSSYSCKASCGVQVEDVGKGLLDADITDMPGGLLSGMGLAGHKVNAHEQHPAFGILGGMGGLLQPPSNSQLNPFGNRQNANFGQQNSFDSPLLNQQFHNPQQQQFHSPQQQQFHNPQQQQFHNPQQQQFHNPQQQQLHNPQQQQFHNLQQQQFHNPQQQLHNPQQQLHNPQQQQFHNLQQQQFHNPQQQQFHNPQQQLHNPQQQQFHNPQQQFHNPQQQQFHNPQHSMNGFFGNPQQNNFGERRNQFAGPHTSYPGHNPLFEENNNNNMFHSQLMDFPQGQFNNGLHHRQPHLMFGNSGAFNNPSSPGSSFERHPRISFRNPAQLLPSAKATQSPILTPTKPITTNIQTNGQSIPPLPADNVSPKVEDVQPTQSPTNLPTQAASVPASDANIPAPTPRDQIESLQPSNSPKVQQILQASRIPVQNNDLQKNQFGEAHPANVFGNFKPINNPFPSAPRQRPLHPYGGNGFMSQPVQKSVSKATSSLHNFMGGFDDFNNGFHGFAADIGGQGHQQAGNSGNQGHFMNNIFGFRRRR